jgi:hypothetical protein
MEDAGQRNISVLNHSYLVFYLWKNIILYRKKQRMKTRIFNFFDMSFLLRMTSENTGSYFILHAREPNNQPSTITKF